MYAQIHRTQHKNYSIKWAIFSVLALILLVSIDQAVKEYIVLHLKNQEFPLLGRLVYFTYAQNYGAAFSIFEGIRWLLIGLPIIMVIPCMFILFSQRIKSTLASISLLLISAGGIGNLIDRIFRVYVVDFINPKFVSFAIFNIADSFVVVGAILLCIHFFIREGQLHRSTNK